MEYYKLSGEEMERIDSLCKEALKDLISVDSNNQNWGE